MTARKIIRRPVGGAQDAAPSSTRNGRKTVPSPNAFSGNSPTATADGEANPRISFGRYRILQSPGRCEIWGGTWQEGYSKLADITIENGQLTIVRSYVKLPKVIIRKLQEQINAK